MELITYPPMDAAKHHAFTSWIKSMPREYIQLYHAPSPMETCPHCHEPFNPAMRGCVQRSPWDAPWVWLMSWWHGTPFPYCSLICERCMDVVGYEAPPHD